jgi:hypothetical protein
MFECLSNKITNLKSEVEQLKTEIEFMPNGEGYKVAKEHFDNASGNPDATEVVFHEDNETDTDSGSL